MSYWIVSKHPNREFISGIDKNGYPIHTDDKEKAYRFTDFNLAMTYFNLGYTITKE